MTIQLFEIIQPFTAMSDAERLDLVKAIRQMKNVDKPDIKQRKKKAAKRESVKQTNKVTSLLSNLTPEQRLALLEELENA